ncbi:hypothetical protein BURPS668_A3196 [Burkholderia pseudomallei 668]|nr:hypothetical protein BURPS668_A3196 [Burkholderia pseudomallei 668]
MARAERRERRKPVDSGSERYRALGLSSCRDRTGRRPVASTAGERAACHAAGVPADR